MKSFSSNIETSPIYSFSALKTKQREVKNRGLREVVHITEKGNAGFVFCSEEVFAREKTRAIQEALYEKRLSEILDRLDNDINTDNLIYGIDALKTELESRTK